MGKRWEETKNKIKSLSIMYSKERKQNMRKEERGLREKMKMELSRADDEEGYSMEKYIEVKMELERYEREKCRGAILRSKAKYALEGEKCTSYFLGLEKSRQSKTYIHEINTKKGEDNNRTMWRYWRGCRSFMVSCIKGEEWMQGSLDEVLGCVRERAGGGR